MRYKKFVDTYVIRLETGEEVIESLKRFVEKEKIRGAFFSGLGAVNDVSLGYFDFERKEYEKKVFEQDFEVTSLVGDVSFLDEKIIIHTHVTLADKDFKIIGGHLNKATVTATLEIVFNPVEGSLLKKLDPKTGLNLLDLKG
jgi:predicted DNA-binding protein with PD1-like motif